MEKKTKNTSSSSSSAKASEPSTCINVMTLKVAELRKHLRDRDLDTSGLKKVLQGRLQEAIDKETDDSSVNETESVKLYEEGMEVNKEAEDETSKIVKTEENKDGQVGQVRCDKETVDSSMNLDVVEVVKVVENDTDVTMKEESTEENIIHQVDDVTRKSVEIIDVDDDVEEDDVEMVDCTTAPTKEGEPDQRNNGAGDDQEMVEDKMEEEKLSHKKSLGHKLLKATRKVFSPNKTKKSPTKPIKEECATDIPSNLNKMSISDDQNTDSSNMEVSKQKHDFSTNNKLENHRIEGPEASSDKRGSIVSKMTEDEIRNGLKIASNPVPNQQSAIKTTVKHPKVVQATPALPSKKPINISSQKKLQSMKEARKLRLDEIRNKVSYLHGIDSISLA